MKSIAIFSFLLTASADIISHWQTHTPSINVSSARYNDNTKMLSIRCIVSNSTNNDVYFIYDSLYNISRPNLNWHVQITLPNKHQAYSAVGYRRTHRIMNRSEYVKLIARENKSIVFNIDMSDLIVVKIDSNTNLSTINKYHIEPGIYSVKVNYYDPIKKIRKAMSNTSSSDILIHIK